MSIKDLARRVIPAALWTRLRLMRLRHSLAKFDRRIVRHQYGGVELQIFLADPVAQGWYDQDWPELSEFRLLARQRLRAGARVFNLGAHQAVVALMLAHRAGPAGMVVAVEPDPHHIEVAKKNKELNHAGNLQILHAAVSEKPGQIAFNHLNAQVDEGSGQRGQCTVRAVSIDELAKEFGCPDVLFIDVEGFECHALRGAANTLKSRPDCYVEVHVAHGLEQFGGSVEQVLAFFPASDYQLMAWSDAHPEPVPISQAGQITRDRFFLVALSRGPR